MTDTLQYNIQGWLTHQKNNVFDMELHYYDSEHPSITPSYTGNITEWKWQHIGEDENVYVFEYDEFSRLMDSRLFVNGWTDRFIERDLTYDRNGNILTLERVSAGLLDDELKYKYDGNQLMSLNNGQHTYEYDVNGNMTKDGFKGLQLDYNLLNLISDVNDANNGCLKAKYSWLVDGSKTGVVNGAGDNGFEYLGSLVYKRAERGLELESAAFREGRIIATNNSYETNYFLKDHLGSTRVVVDDNGNIKETSNYYPFGGRWEDSGGRVSDNRYRYNGKEDQVSMGVDYLDYGARMYDSRLGRWHSADPLAEKYYSHSPYNYVMNNPMKYIDPDGRDIWEIDDYRYITNKIEDPSQDTFHNVDNNGKRRTDRFIEFEYGTVEMHTEYTFSPNGSDVYRLRGDENATRMFEFMSENTIVEWGQSKTGVEGEEGLNFVTSSHQESRESGTGNLYAGQLYGGYTIREMIHNHPANTPYPSGLNGSGGDIGFARAITQHLEENNLNVPIFKIYLPQSGEYVPFSSKSIRGDYEK